MTLQHTGCKTILITTEYPKPDSCLLFNIPGRIAFRTKVTDREDADLKDPSARLAICYRSAVFGSGRWARALPAPQTADQRRE